MKKEKTKEDIVDIPELNLRLRLSEELNVPNKEIEHLKENITSDDQEFIMFRYKQRTSLIVFDDSNVTIRIDLTQVDADKNPNRLEMASSTYELELELNKKKENANAKYLQTYLDELKTLINVVQQSNFILDEPTKINVLNQYEKLISLNKDITYKQTIRETIASMQVYSLEIQHVTDRVPNKYACTDKADGEHCFCQIFQRRIFIIYSLMHVVDTGVILEGDDYNNTIMDGEQISLNHHKTLTGLFDLLIFKGKDVRGIGSLMERHQLLDEVVDYIYQSMGWKKIPFKKFEGKSDLRLILENHKKNMMQVLKTLNENIKNYDYFLYRKYFMYPLGVQDNEIFKYLALMWNVYTEKSELICPYALDGLVLQPLNQPYTILKREIVNQIYKWKPPEKNTIDFYVLFLRDDDNKIIDAFDNSDESLIPNKPYRICHLYVGKKTPNGERPIKFGVYRQEDEVYQKKENQRFVAYLYLEDGEVRDMEGNPIQDGTVVEFVYKFDNNLDPRLRWVPMRTRYDKTESVLKYGKKYGNYHEIAERVWRSIINPVLMDDFIVLQNDKNYETHIRLLRSRVSAKLIALEQRENAYYQKISSLAKPWRTFHNWVKSILIYTHCDPTFNDGKKNRVLDLGIGRGGDLMKYFHARVETVVGIDPDSYGLFMATDGAVSRYKQFRRQRPTFMPMHFIQANPGYLLQPKAQNAAIHNMTDQNQKLIEEFFGEKTRKPFDRLVSMFTIHFLLANETLWNNLLENINRYLKVGGIMIICTWDGRKVFNLLKGQEHYFSYYTENGKKEVMLEIVRKYQMPKDPDTILGTGYGIDIFDPTKNQIGQYYTEYLVDPKFLKHEFKKKCQMELIDSATFEELFKINKNFFTKGYYQAESVMETKIFFQEASEYYDQKNEINKACFTSTHLSRYYIFRKTK